MSPCNARAVQTARLNVDISAILDNQVAIDACAKLIASLWGIPESEVAIGKRNDLVRFDAGGGIARTVILHRSGLIEAWPGQDLDALKALIEQVAGLVLQQNVRQAIAAQYQILEEQTAPNGALVLSIEL